MMAQLKSGEAWSTNLVVSAVFDSLVWCGYLGVISVLPLDLCKQIICIIYIFNKVITSVAGLKHSR